MAKTNKNLLIILIAILIINLVFCSRVNAVDDMISKADEFLAWGTDDKINEDNLARVSRNIYNVLFIIAVGIAVIVGAIIGIKIMTGTIEEKAKMKEMLIPYVVGVVVIFSVFFIWSTIVKMCTSIVGDGAHDSSLSRE